MTTISWRRISASVFYCTAGRARIGSCQKRPGGKWVARVTYEGHQGDARGAEPVATGWAAVKAAFDARARSRGYADRAAEVEALNEETRKHAELLRASGVPVKITRHRTL